MRATSPRIALGASALVLAMAGALAAQGPALPQNPRDDPEQVRKVLNQAMAKKLKHAQELVAALALEDFVRLADNARTLRQIGQDTLWKVSPNLTYVKYSAEFASAAEELERRAKERDLNGATLSYVRLTISCVECHKFIRDNRILDPKL